MNKIVLFLLFFLSSVGVVKALDSECRTFAKGDYFNLSINDVSPEVDVLFAFDTTPGSMSVFIDVAAKKMDELMLRLEDLFNDKVRFGILPFQDNMGFPYCCETYSKDCCNCGFMSSTCPFELAVSLTKDKTIVNSYIKLMKTSNDRKGREDNGADGKEEAYLRIMYEAYSNKGIGWRDGAKKILVFFGDGISRDPDLSPTKGVSLIRKDVIAELQNSGIAIIYLETDKEVRGIHDGPCPVLGHWGKIAGELDNGSQAICLGTDENNFVPVTSGALVDTVSKINNLYLKTNPIDYLSWLDYGEKSSIFLSSDSAGNKFEYKFIPRGVKRNVFEFNVELMGDKVKYAEKNQKIKVDCRKLGDFNDDGVVNIADYSVWRKEYVDMVSWTKDGSWASADVSRETVTSEDYSIWRFNFLK